MKKIDENKVEASSLESWQDLIRKIFGYTLFGTLIIAILSFVSKFLQKTLTLSGLLLIVGYSLIWQNSVTLKNYLGWRFSKEYYEAGDKKRTEREVAEYADYVQNLPALIERCKAEIEDYKFYNTKRSEIDSKYKDVWDFDKKDAREKAESRLKYLNDLQTKLRKMEFDLNRLVNNPSKTN